MSETAIAVPDSRRQLGRQRWSDTLIFVVVVLALWEVASRLLGEDALVSPAGSLAHIVRLLSSAYFWRNVGATALVFIEAAALTLAGGLVIGLLLGYFRLAGEIFDPLIGATYAIPKITLYPIVLLIFGISVSAKVAFGVLHGIFPMIIFTMSGIKSIRPVILHAARMMHLSPAAVMWQVMMPAALPDIFTGFRVSFSLVLFGTLIGEMFASDRGLGYLLMRGIEHSDSGTIMAIALMLFALSSLTGAVLLRIDRHLHRYRAQADH